MHSHTHTCLGCGDVLCGVKLLQQPPHHTHAHPHTRAHTTHTRTPPSAHMHTHALTHAHLLLLIVDSEPESRVDSPGRRAMLLGRMRLLEQQLHLIGRATLVQQRHCELTTLQRHGLVRVLKPHEARNFLPSPPGAFWVPNPAMFFSHPVPSLFVRLCGVFFALFGVSWPQEILVCF